MFAGLHSLDDTAEGAAAVEMALKNPAGYVMKPQREGGGSLLFHEEMTQALKTMPVEERAAHILMDRINSAVRTNPG